MVIGAIAQGDIDRVVNGIAVDDPQRREPRPILGRAGVDLFGVGVIGRIEDRDTPLHISGKPR